MKKSMLTLTLALLTSASFGAVCPKPNEYAASAFKIIEGAKASDLETYLREFTVARTALNEKCEDMYMASIRTKNDIARQYLDKIGYGPKTADAINTRINNFYMNAFEYAIAFGNLATIKDLYARGGTTYNGLYYATNFNSIDVIDYIATIPKTPLVGEHLVNAVKNNKKTVIEQLIRRGVDVNSKNLLSSAILRVAGNPEDKDILELLVRAGASLNSYTDMALAAEKVSTDVLDFLIRAGGPVNAPVLSGAIKGSRIDNVKLLVKAGARLDERLGNGETMIMAAVISGKTETVEYLISEGLDVGALDDSGNNAFIFAGDVKMVKYLISKGLDINHLNRDGKSALHIALEKKNSYAMDVLAKGGANVNLPTGLGYYPVVSVIKDAAGCESPEAMLKVLLDNGANVNQKDKEGYTPLLRAAVMSGCGSSDEARSSKGIANSLIKILLLKKADKRPKVKNGRHGWNAQDWYQAVNNSDRDIYNLLAP